MARGRDRGKGASADGLLQGLHASHHATVGGFVLHAHRFCPYLCRTPVLPRPTLFPAAMHEHGFEYALTEGFPRNPNPWRYKFTPPCCKVKHTDTYRCAHDWTPDTSIPKGDPITGKEWNHPRPDPGTYEGGTVF